MKIINLSGVYRCQNRSLYVAVVDDEDCDYLSQFSWAAVVTKAAGGRLYVRARRKEVREGKPAYIYMHREVFERASGQAIPFGLTVDHIKHGEFGALDNRRSNLRLASRKDQQGNRRKGSRRTSQWKGVFFHPPTGKWDAYIRADRRTKNLGRFSSEDVAARAYDAAARDHFGEFARLNFPERAA